MRPVPVAAPLLALRRWRRLGRVALEPARDFIVIELLGPEQSGGRLPHDAELLALRRILDARFVEAVCFHPALIENRREVVAKNILRPLVLGHQSQAKAPTFARRDD